MPWTYNGKNIREGRSWQDDAGIKHPPTWGRWSDEEKEAKGLVWVDPPSAETYDQRFFWGPDNPKDLDALKVEWVARVKDDANKRMATTDWIFIRQEEQGSKLPRRVAAYRQLTRKASNDIEDALLAAETHEDFVAAATSMEWPPQPEDLTEEQLAEKLPLPNFIVRSVLGSTRIAIVDAYIASLPEGEAKATLKAKWETGPIFHFDHADTQGIAAVIQSQEAEFDVAVAWSAGEALRYEEDGE